MTTKAEFITRFKAEYPTIKVGSEGNYTRLTPTEYEARIGKWADAQVAAEVELAEVTALADNKASAIAKLTSPTYIPLNAAEAATLVL